MTQANAVMQPPSPLDLRRVESLGDNCELGFVLRRLGCEDGMLFRWASIPAASLVATLRGDFDGLYEYENLIPHRDAMVLDRKYGTSWHTGMSSHFQAGIRCFAASEAERRQTFDAERRKRSHLVAKLRDRFRQPAPVFVFKSNEPPSDALIEALHYQLLLRVPSPDFLLLDVRADPGRAGSVEPIGRTLLRGYVSRFASYENAADGDDASWRAILAQALAHGRQHAGRAGVGETAVAEIVLPFPPVPVEPATQLLTGDLRAGSARLFRGNGWCRPVDDGIFRLHAAATGTAATELRWSGVRLPPGWTIDLLATCAIPESLPVQATLIVTDDDGVSAQEDRTFRPERPERFLVRPIRATGDPVGITLRVEPLEPLRNGERAVIDVQPIVCRPSQT